MMKKLSIFALALLFMFTFNISGARATDIYNDGEIVIDSNNLYPKTDGGSTLGKSGNEFAGLYVDSITLGGEAKTSWGSVVSPMTDYDGYVAPTDAGSKLKLYDDGDITLGGAVATDVVIIFDSDTNDYYVGVNDTENELQIGYGSSIGTTEQISITSGAAVYLGEDTDVDFGLIFQSGAQDYYIGIDYTGGQEEDLLCIGTGTTVGTNAALSIGKASGTVYVNHLDAPGNVDFDIGSADVDDVTVVTDGGTLILDGTITLTSSEVISNATDDTVRIASNDLDTVLEIYTPYDTTGDATLKLSADLGDEAGEQWTITSTGETTDLVIACDDSVSGTPVTTFTIADNGVVTTTNYVDNKITDTTTNAVVDVCKLTHDGGTAAAGVGVGLVFQIDDAGGIEEQGSIDVSLSTVTDGQEDADLIVSLNQYGTMREVLRIDSDLGDTGTNVLEYTGWTTETNGIVDLVELKLETPADTSTAGFGMGISFQLEDETDAVEEQASIDLVVTDATTTAENCDMVVQLNSIGTMREVLRIDTDVTATAVTTFEMTGWTIETNGIVDMLELKLENTADTATDDIGMGISFQIEDETSVEEHASIDVQLTTAARATCDTDIIFRQDVNGTMEERVRFDADSKTISAVGTTPIISVGDGGNEDNTLLFDGQTTKDFYIATDNADDSLIIGVGSTVGTDSRITVQDNASETRIELGDAVTAEDTVVVFDGNAQDYYIALDDSADDLLIGLGAVVATTPAIGIDENQDVHMFQDLVVDKTINFGIDSGTSDDYVISLPVAPAGYTAGMQITFIANTANTGACTLDVNSLGAKALKSLHDQDPTDNYIEASSVVMCVYDGTTLQIISPDANP